MEEWKAIPGYEGLYEISNKGQIRVPEGRMTVDSSGRVKHWPMKMLKIKFYKRRTSNKFDAKVSLCRNGKVKDYRVARLVAMVWCKGYREGLTVNHIDGNPCNNNSENLEWVSNLDNVRHGFITGQYAAVQKPCTLIDQYGNKSYFKTRKEACESIGRNALYITKCLRIKRPIRSSNGDRYDFA